MGRTIVVMFGKWRDEVNNEQDDSFQTELIIYIILLLKLCNKFENVYVSENIYIYIYIIYIYISQSHHHICVVILLNSSQYKCIFKK